MLTGRLVLPLGLAVAALLSGAVSAQPAASSAAATRQANFRALNADLRAVNEQLRRAEPDMETLRAASKRLVEASKDLPKWFPAGSGPESGERTAAKPEIWSNAAAFAAVAGSFSTEARKFDRLTRGKDLDALKLQAKTLGGECAACHNDFRGTLPPPAAPAG